MNRAVLEGHAFCEEVALQDFTVTNEDEYVLECRCGGEFKVLKSDFSNGFIYFCCSNCSLKIKVIDT